MEIALASSVTMEKIFYLQAQPFDESKCIELNFPKVTIFNDIILPSNRKNEEGD